MRENSVYHPLNEVDKDGFRPVKININERGEEAFFRYKVINKNKVKENSSFLEVLRLLMNLRFIFLGKMVDKIGEKPL